MESFTEHDEIRKSLCEKLRPIYDIFKLFKDNVVEPFKYMKVSSLHNGSVLQYNMFKTGTPADRITFHRDGTGDKQWILVEINSHDSFELNPDDLGDKIGLDLLFTSLTVNMNWYKNPKTNGCWKLHCGKNFWNLILLIF